MAVGGTFGVLAKGTVNRLMKVSLRRGKQQATSRPAGTRGRPLKGVLVCPTAVRFHLLVGEVNADETPKETCCTAVCTRV